jgi:hypothetical protein
VGAPTFSNVECLGSSNSNRFTPQAGTGTEYTVVGNQFLPFPQPGSSPPGIFDFNNYEFLQRQDKRFQAGLMAHEELNDYVQPYMEFGWMDDRSVAVVAPSGTFIGGDPFTADNNELINCSNPLLSAQQRSLICTSAQIAGDTANPGSKGNSADVSIGRRNIEGGGRTSLYEHNNIRVVIGTKGNVVDGWTYDLYGSYYYVTTFQSNTDYLDYSKINNALQVTTNPTTGVPMCISGGQCVPWNIFKEGGVTPAALSYLSTPGTAFGNNTEQIAHADLTGELGKYGLQTPWANDGAAVNLGYEHRMDSITFRPDGAELSGDLAGFSGALVNINEHYDINEGFVELRLPIAHNQPGIDDLTTDVGYRYSNYNTTGTTNTYKFEVQYAPNQDARLRFSFDRAIRAPNLIELFVAPSFGQEAVVGTDPCAGVPTASFEQCAHTGVTRAQYNINPATGVNSITQCVSGQCGQVIEGNTQLKPEVANTWSLGLTLTPTALPGFTRAWIITTSSSRIRLGPTRSQPFSMAASWPTTPSTAARSCAHRKAPWSVRRWPVVAISCRRISTSVCPSCPASICSRTIGTLSRAHGGPSVPLSTGPTCGTRPRPRIQALPASTAQGSSAAPAPALPRAR